MDSIVKFTEAVIDEAKRFSASCLENNDDYNELDLLNQQKTLCFCASVLATFRLVLIASKMKETDFFKE